MTGVEDGEPGDGVHPDDGLRHSGDGRRGDEGGAWDFVTKPFKRIQIVKAVKRALDRQTLSSENQALRAELEGSRRDRSIIGNSISIRQTLDLVSQVAPSRALRSS